MQSTRFRAVRCIVTAMAATLVLTGCAGHLAGAAPVVTVTDTSWQAPVPQDPAPSASPVGEPGGTGWTASGGDEAHDRPTARTSDRPPASSSRPSPASPASPVNSVASTTTATSRSHTTAGRPPGSLSTHGDLIAAAISAAAKAGVAPANPDTPGPRTGPACPADAAYVNEPPTGLRSDVITAWRAAVAAAARQDVTLCLNDGKRSRAQQQAQYDEYAEEYGKDVADQLVLQPNKSAHVIGIAVDVQPASGYRWLQATDGSLGFCRIYDNEAWHFEFDPAYRHTGCPPRLPEPER